MIFRGQKIWVMIFISATRLRVRSIFYFFNFYRANESAVKELRKTTGFRGGKELMDKGLVFWTLTMWQDEVSMRSFRNSAPHRRAMQKLPTWCSEAAYVHWIEEAEQLPDWETVHAKMVADGKLTKVKQPSPQQPAKSYPPLNWRKFERIFKTGPLS